jgi:hypothetical protein
LTTKVTVKKKSVSLKLSCSVAACKGKITLADVNTALAINGGKNYSLGAGTSATFSLGLNSNARTLLAHAKGHTITAHETVTVTGGRTVTVKVTVVG